MSQTIKVGLIGGTGLADLLREGGGGKRHELKTPFGSPSDAIVETEWENLPVLLLGRHGPGHMLNPSQVPFRATFSPSSNLDARTSSPPARWEVCGRN